MKNKRLLILVILLLFSIVMIFAYSKITLKTKNKQSLSSPESLIGFHVMTG